MHQIRSTMYPCQFLTKPSSTNKLVCRMTEVEEAHNPTNLQIPFNGSHPLPSPTVVCLISFGDWLRRDCLANEARVIFQSELTCTSGEKGGSIKLIFCWSSFDVPAFFFGDVARVSAFHPRCYAFSCTRGVPPPLLHPIHTRDRAEGFVYVLDSEPQLPSSPRYSSVCFGLRWW